MLVNTKKEHWKKIDKFCRLLGNFNDNVGKIKQAIKNQFNVYVNEKGKVTAFKCQGCGRHYSKPGWAIRHKC